MKSDLMLQQIFDSNFEKIYRFFFYKTFSREDAEDLTSEVFLAFASKINFNHEINNYEDYLYGIARNVFTNFLKRKYQLPEESINDYPNISEEFNTENSNLPSLKDLARKHIGKLPEKQAHILHLRLIEQKSLTEICNLLGKDMNYVKTTQKRAIHSLKKILACTPLPT